MTKHKLKIRLAALLLALSFSNVIIAAEISNENKDNRAGNTVSNADYAGHANGNTGFTVTTKADTSTEQKQQYTSYAQSLQQMEARRRQLQKDQREAYKRYMQSRKQPSSESNELQPDTQARREAYIRYMSERRELMNNMMDQRRKDAQQRRQATLKKMQPTSSTPVTAGKT